MDVEGASAARLAGDRPARPRVVILGAGFGGLNAATALKRAPVEVTVIDRRNYHLFQPLLYQVATAGLSPAQIGTPIRLILRRQANATVLMDQVEGIDRAGRVVLLQSGKRVGFDYLVIATGARHAYFGHDDWEGAAPGLKKIDDATLIRRRILTAFEAAETAEDETERARLLTFVIVGGGPTGVELAGAIAELARKAVRRDFRRIDTSRARILLVEAGPRILSSFPESLSIAALRQLQELGVEVLLGKPVTACDTDGVTVGDSLRIPSACVVWGAGVMASPAARWLDAEKDAAGRVIVTTSLALPGDPSIFVIGDTAAVRGEKGQLVPGVAPAAKQMGRHVAKLIRRRIAGSGNAEEPFRYRDYGNLATIGRSRAVADFGRLRLSGFPAWALWCVAHIFFLIGFRNRIVVMMEWAWAYLTYERGARLITG
ncbi:MAG: NAD(P)/FAD-dependent oxidoreductase [Parvibaculaceae bacterium]